MAIYSPSERKKEKPLCTWCFSNDKASLGSGSDLRYNYCLLHGTKDYISKYMNPMNKKKSISPIRKVTIVCFSLMIVNIMLIKLYSEKKSIKNVID